MSAMTPDAGTRRFPSREIREIRVSELQLQFSRSAVQLMFR